MYRSYPYRGRTAPRTGYPACPITDCTNDSVENRNVFCDDMVLAMAYILKQDFDDVYEVDNGYHRGTIFAQLDKPLLVGGVTCE